MIDPMIIPMAISLKSRPPNEKTVATIAMSIPTEANAFPVRAVLGELNRLIPRINKMRKNVG